MIAFMSFWHNRTATILLFFFTGCIYGFAQVQVVKAVPTPQNLSTSPDGKFVVYRTQAESGERGEARKNIEICSTSGKVLYAWVSGLGTTAMLWSPDCRYLAVNDMPGESGDLVRLFHLDPEKSTVIPIRESNGKKLQQDEESRHGSFFSSVERVNLRAQEWKEGRLWCRLTGSSHPKRQPMVHVAFHHLWVFSMHGDSAPILEEEWTLTDPKEKSIRDPVQ